MFNMCYITSDQNLRSIEEKLYLANESVYPFKYNTRQILQGGAPPDINRLKMPINYGYITHKS